MQSGDLLFYTSSGSTFDKLIAWWTKSRFVHVAIAISANEKIEMLGQGCVKTRISEKAVAGVWVANYPTTLGPDVALAWLEQQVGTPYGWNDILESVDTSHKFLWLQTNHVDCSHLASDFLQRAGYDMAGLEPDHARVTPGMLANFLKVH